ALAWTVREGVTNVIRHSRARVCTIAIRSEADGIGVEVSDDGEGSSEFRVPNSERLGSGVAGLAERVRALGGRFEAGPRAEGGFRLAVWVPVGEVSPPGPPILGVDERPLAERELVGRT